jgi:hypothetical protein
MRLVMGGRHNWQVMRKSTSATFRFLPPGIETIMEKRRCKKARRWLFRLLTRTLFWSLEGAVL